MKRTVSLILILGILFSIVCFEGKFKNAKAESKDDIKTTENAYVKAIWLSQFDMSVVYTKNCKQRDAEEYTSLINNVITNISELGFNTVFIQLRPNGDSIYPSQLFPASKYVCGSYSNDFLYDPFIIFLNQAKEKGLSVHAWINPLRCMTESEIKNIDNSYPLYDWYAQDKYLVNVNGRYYLDPAHKEVREYVCAGIKEILSNYDVDGIHIDDYFYPTTDTCFDANSYCAYLEDGGSLSLSDFRRNNINLLIKDIYKTVKGEKSNAWFGVSPSGNTNRNYNELYADVALWCSNSGYIDYICPQIYFGFEHSTHSFDKICNQFSDMVTADSVRLFIGITLDKASLGSDGKEDSYAGSGKNEWIEHKDIVARSLIHCKNTDNCSGVAIFSYQHFYDPISNTENTKTAEERDNLLPIFKYIEY